MASAAVADAASSSRATALPRAPRILVTVGSTQFADLVSAMLSKRVVEAICQACPTSMPTLIVQYGATPLAEVLLGPLSALAQSGTRGKDGPMTNDAQSGASGSWPIPLSALSGKQSTSHSSTEEAVDEEGTAQAFRLKQQSMLDRRSELQEDESVLRAKFTHFTFTIPYPEIATRGSTFHNQDKAIRIELRDYVDNLTPLLRTSDIVISHAGSGTLLEALRLPEGSRPKLVVVPNESLMDNHQVELAQALAKQSYVVATRVGSQAGRENRLPELLQVLLQDPPPASAPRLVPFPPFVPGRFQSFIDAEMGYL